MKVDSLCTACESELDLSSASLSASYYYDSLSYDAAHPPAKNGLHLMNAT